MKKIIYAVAALALSASAVRAETVESLREKAANMGKLFAMALNDTSDKTIVVIPAGYPHKHGNTGRRDAFAEDIMSPLQTWVNASDTIAEALRKVKREDMQEVVILDGMQPLGYTDVWKLGIADPDLKVGDAIKQGKLFYAEIASAYPNTPVRVLLQGELSKKVGKLRKKVMVLIISDNGTPIGLITDQDILKTFDRHDLCLD